MWAPTYIIVVEYLDLSHLADYLHAQFQGLMRQTHRSLVLASL